MDNDVSNQRPLDKDDAVAMVGEVQHAIDPLVEARAVRKIDLFLIPAMICGCQFYSILTYSEDWL
jgi:hypothetical protein